METNQVSVNTKVKGRSRYYMLFMIIAAYVAVGIMSAKTQALAPFFAVDLKLDAVQVGAVQGAYTIGMIPLLFLGGIVADFIGGKKVVLFSLFAGALFSVLMALAPGYKPFYIYTLLFGFAFGALIPGSMRLMTNWFPASELSTATSRFYTGGVLTSIIGTPIALGIASHWNWQSAFYVVAAIAIPVALWMMFFGPESPEKKKNIDPGELAYITAGRVKADKPSFRELLKVMSNRSVILAILAAAIGLSMIQPVSMWAFMGLMTYRGITASQIMLVMPISGGIIAIYGFFLHGRIIQKVFKGSFQKTVLIGGLLHAAMALAMAFWTNIPWWLYMFFSLSIGMALALFLQGVTPGYYMRIAGPKYVASLVGTHGFLSVLMMSVFMTLSGKWLNTSAQGLAIVAPVMIIAAVLIALGSILPLFGKRVDLYEKVSEAAGE